MDKHHLIKLKNPPVILSSYSVVGKKENEGPLAKFFDEHDDDARFGCETWEQGESEMQKRAMLGAVGKTGISFENIDVIFAGDLQNQCAASNYAVSDMPTSYFGLYGACSTIGEGLLLASLLVSQGTYENSLVVSSSHFCTAERQFRFPLPYGNQRQPIAQRTVTGSGAFLLANGGFGPKITEVLPGRIVDKGVTDANNMGAAMAPAAADTLLRYFRESGKRPEDFDLISTGDLANEGSEILKILMDKEGMPLSLNYTDCGLMIYNIEGQDVHSGASGCGCCAITMAGYYMNKLLCGEIKDMLLVPTGALMSAGALQQGCSIPSIAHLIRIQGGGKV